MMTKENYSKKSDQQTIFYLHNGVLSKAAQGADVPQSTIVERHSGSEDSQTSHENQ